MCKFSLLPPVVIPRIPNHYSWFFVRVFRKTFNFVVRSWQLWINCESVLCYTEHWVVASDLCRASRLVVDLTKYVTALVATNIIVWVVSINEISHVKTGIEQTAETSFMSHIAVTVGTGHYDLDMMKQAEMNVILFLYCVWIILQRCKWCSPCSVMW